MAKKRSKKLRPTPSVTKVAEILSHADITSVSIAAKRFDVSERSIWRWKSRAESGRWPEVADLVRTLKGKAVEQIEEPLNKVYKQALDLMSEKMPSATYRELLETVVETGGLKAFKDMFDAGGPNSKPGSSGAANAGPNASAPGGAGIGKALRIVKG